MLTKRTGDRGKRAGREVQVMPRSLYRRSSFAAPVRALPASYEPRIGCSRTLVSAEINF
jgi:hypothetical protein